ncbi:hypothetical protein D3C78_1704310 [compost metagenome]
MLIVPIVAITDAVIGPGKARVEQVMGTGSMGLPQGLLQAQRRPGATHHREVLDKALECRLSDRVGARIVAPGRSKRTLADENEGVWLQP